MVLLPLAGATWLGLGLYFQAGGAAPIGAAAGAFLGLYLVRRNNHWHHSWHAASRRDTDWDVERLAHHRTRVAPERYDSVMAHYGASETTFEPIRGTVDRADIVSMFRSIERCAASDDEKFVADVALIEALDGVMPSREGLAMLEAVFGRVFAQTLRSKV